MAKNTDASTPIPYLPAVGYMTQGKLSNLPELEFPYLKNGDNNSTCFIILELCQFGP